MRCMQALLNELNAVTVAIAFHNKPLWNALRQQDVQALSQPSAAQETSAQLVRTQLAVSY